MIGTGYVGLTTGLGFAKLGHNVACVDKDSSKIAKLDMGEAPFYEPGLAELLKEMQDSGRILFTTDVRRVLDGAEVIVIAVGTPPTATGEADLSYVLGAASEVGSILDHGAIVMTKSTVPVGTNRRVLHAVREAMCEAGRKEMSELVHTASVPEFLREGSAIEDFMNPDRIVIGAD